MVHISRDCNFICSLRHLRSELSYSTYIEYKECIEIRGIILYIRVYTIQYILISYPTWEFKSKDLYQKILCHEIGNELFAPEHGSELYNVYRATHLGCTEQHTWAVQSNTPGLYSVHCTEQHMYCTWTIPSIGKQHTWTIQRARYLNTCTKCTCILAR